MKHGESQENTSGEEGEAFDLHSLIWIFFVFLKYFQSQASKKRSFGKESMMIQRSFGVKVVKLGFPSLVQEGTSRLVSWNIWFLLYFQKILFSGKHGLDIISLKWKLMEYERKERKEYSKRQKTEGKFILKSILLKKFSILFILCRSKPKDSKITAEDGHEIWKYRQKEVEWLSGLVFASTSRTELNSNYNNGYNGYCSIFGNDKAFT